MDPAKLAADLLQKNFPKFGSFRKLCKYQQLGNDVYNAATGASHREQISEQPVWIIFDMPSTGAMQSIGLAVDDPIIKKLRVAIFPSLDLHVIPKIHDEIVREDSSVWRVIGLIEDPGPAHYELVVQPVGPVVGP